MGLLGGEVWVINESRQSLPLLGNQMTKPTQEELNRRLANLIVVLGAELTDNRLKDKPDEDSGDKANKEKEPE